MSATLLLNATFEPLKIISWQRAVTLLFLGKADLVEAYDEVIRGISASVAMPSVVRLRRYARHDRRVKFSRCNVYRRDDYTCQYCGRRMRTLTLDHVVPRRYGGPHTWTNLVAACSPCNRRKGGKMPAEAEMVLRRLPYEPSPTAAYRFGTHLEQRQEWAQFIEGW